MKLILINQYKILKNIIQSFKTYYESILGQKTFTLNGIKIKSKFKTLEAINK